MAKFNRCKMPKELAIIFEKIASLTQTTSKKSKSIQNSSSQSSSEDYVQNNEYDCYEIDIDELLAQEKISKDFKIII